MRWIVLIFLFGCGMKEYENHKVHGRIDEDNVIYNKNLKVIGRIKTTDRFEVDVGKPMKATPEHEGFAKIKFNNVSGWVPIRRIKFE
jgi:hypothetical protein